MPRFLARALLAGGVACCGSLRAAGLFRKAKRRTVQDEAFKIPFGKTLKKAFS